MKQRPPDPSAVVAGRRAVAELLRAAPERIKTLYVARGVKLTGELNDLVSALPRAAIKQIERRELATIAGTEVHQGIAALADPGHTHTLEELLAAKNGSGIIVVLDEVTDPHNLGAVLRAAETAGAEGVVVTERRSSPLSPVARKASAGASEIIPCVRATNLQRALKQLKDAGFWIVGTAMAPGSLEVSTYKFPERVALVFGSEGKGMRQLTTRECDELVMIPMYGKVASLNVSQAAAIVLYEVRSQRSGKR